MKTFQCIGISPHEALLNAESEFGDTCMVLGIKAIKESPDKGIIYEMAIEISEEDLKANKYEEINNLPSGKIIAYDSRYIIKKL